MRIVVLGGHTLADKIMQGLSARGHEAVAASRETGVDTTTGDGLDAVLTGAQVVVDVGLPLSDDDAEVLDFFQTSTRNLLKAEDGAGVGHHVGFSFVGADRVPDSGYMRAKVAQENLIRDSDVAYTIVRSTQFFEFLPIIADSATVGDAVHVPSAVLQPIAAVDVADAMTEVALSAPLNGVVEIAGPEKISFSDLIRAVLAATNDPRAVVGEEHARYLGTELTDTSFTAGPAAQLGRTRFADWLAGDAGN